LDSLKNFTVPVILNNDICYNSTKITENLAQIVQSKVNWVKTLKT